jgi:hypothetical protein
MFNECIKKLIGKKIKEAELAAAAIVDTCDIESFNILVKQSDFLFDFIKQNVKKRFFNVINYHNFRNLLKFLKIYSSDYEDLIVVSLVKFADEDLTDTILELFEKGTDEEKAYCAKYFQYVNDTLAIDLLKKYSYSDFEPLAFNCAGALAVIKDEDSYNLAIEKLKSEDEFEKLYAVKFLVAYNDLRAVNVIFETMKKSAMPENIASELSYLKSFLEFLDTDFKYDTILALNHIINGLGEIISLEQILDFQLFAIFSKLIKIQKEEKNSKIALVLLNAKLKFEQLTENDEYLFDENKATKEEVYYIKEFLNSQSEEFWQIQKELFQQELTQWSDFIFFALDLVQELNLEKAFEKLKALLDLNNQTILLRVIELIKYFNKLNEIDKQSVLEKISDENIKLIVKSLFN